MTRIHAGSVIGAALSEGGDVDCDGGGEEELLHGGGCWKEREEGA